MVTSSLFHLLKEAACQGFVFGLISHLFQPVWKNHHLLFVSYLSFRFMTSSSWFKLIWLCLKRHFFWILCVMVHYWGFGNTDTQAYVFTRFSIVAQPSADPVITQASTVMVQYICFRMIRLWVWFQHQFSQGTSVSPNKIKNIHIRLFGHSKLSLCELMICDFSERILNFQDPD